MLTSHAFLLTLRDTIVIFFCFVLFFFVDLPRGSGQHFQPDVSLVQLESFSLRLLTLAHAPSTQKNIAAHIRSYQTFCELRALQPFPISVQSIILYISYLVAQKRAYGTILNHIRALNTLINSPGMNSLGVPIIVSSFCYAAPNVF